jgi:dipeptidyl aminopeptidase/acylaminoacyl peptidase
MSEPFDFDQFLALPRLSALRLSPDGRRLVVAVATPAPDGKKMRTALWSVDPSGDAPPRRLTRSAAGENGAAFLPDGSILFASERRDPDAKADDDEPPAGLWHLPADGGEARLLVAPPDGVGDIRVARTAGTIAFTTGMHPGADDFEADREREKARKDAGVSALLFERYPIRFWDHYLGPRETRIFVADPPSDDDAALGTPTDLTGATQERLVELTFDVAPDGSQVVTTWRRYVVGANGDDLVLIDRTTKARRALAEGAGFYSEPAFSPDGRSVAAVFGTDGTRDEASRTELVTFDVATGERRRIAASLDQWPASPTWSADGSAVFLVADDHGAAAVFRVDLADDRVTRLAGDASYSDLCPSPDGAWVYALRSNPDRPPHVVRLDARAGDQTPVELRSPATPESGLPRRGVLERVTAAADDGVEIGSWLLRPAGASAETPAPLVVFVHGGPLGAWAGWSWRWNANLLVERGYAVLMPDPAISLGYGQAFIDRGWGRWGHRPYTDVMAAVDGALERVDLDSTRTGLMGGSFGGYMANWIAGHTDRFRAIVTHASLWELRGFHGTTDDGVWWEQEMGDPYADPSLYIEHSPDASIAEIRTPMLVIHGEKDARVPISEGLRLWTDLMRHGVDAKFLYYPDENHWILKPQNARVWYETVLAFLDQHVLDREWQRPTLL